MEEMILYHGSQEIVRKPLFGKGKKHNDYGLGFYCTENVDLAKEWSVKKNCDGFINEYSLDVLNLKILYLNSLPILCWLAVLIENRIFDSYSEFSEEAKSYLLSNYLPKYREYDVIIGYRADDSYFSFAQAFLDGSLSLRNLEKAMPLGNLGEQVVLKSRKAFEQISFLGYEKADARIYYPLRQERNMNARKEFLSNRRGTPTLDDLFLSDIIRGGISADDPRIQWAVFLYDTIEISGNVWTCR